MFGFMAWVRLMPAARRAWASWNYHRLREDRDRVAVTYWQNRLQRLTSDVPYLVTLNRADAIDRVGTGGALAAAVVDDPADIVKLASNENPLGPSPLVRQAILDQIDDIGRYPDGGGFHLKEAIAERHGLVVFSDEIYDQMLYDGAETVPVATLVEGVRDAGRYTVTWDGRGEAGAPVGAGVYLMRLSSPAGTQVQKVMLTK